MIIELPSDEFTILKDDAEAIHLFDKIVNKVYVYDKLHKSWSFPAGSREWAINKLTGLEL